MSNAAKPTPTLQDWGVILENRKARLKKLLSLEAPEVILDQERELIKKAESEISKLRSKLS